jgi:hypothetical protein
VRDEDANANMQKNSHKALRLFASNREGMKNLFLSAETNPLGVGICGNSLLALIIIDSPG